MHRTICYKAILCLFVCLFGLYAALPTFFNLKSYRNIFVIPSVNLGIDLKGGAYILLNVDSQSYIKERMSSYIQQIKKHARANDVIFGINFSESKISLHLKQAKEGADIKKLIFDAIGDIGVVSSDDKRFTISVYDSVFRDMRKNLVAQSIEIIRKRVDEEGTKEIEIQRQGQDNILLQIPGIEDPKEVKRLIGKTAKLTFHIVKSNYQEGRDSPVGLMFLPLVKQGNQSTHDYSQNLLPIVARPSLEGKMLKNATATFSDRKQPVVAFEFDHLGAKIFGQLTSDNIGKRIAIVLDKKIISAPQISEPILSGSGRISGNFTIRSANELALLLRAGALPAPINVIEERSTGPSLGADSVKSGIMAVLVAILIITIFMILAYKGFGMIANIALIFNLIIIVAILACISATLTLPGIAGIVLTIGMSVDANILIFERIREEVRRGATKLHAINSGYNKSFVTIMDSNITTMVAAMVLYSFGTGSVKGFAITLFLGILSSMFTAITLTRVLHKILPKVLQPKRLPS